MARRRKKTEEQMKLFEEGGLKDEGGSVDPVSGNDVPSGSTQAEVRDDIPAQLSEGEFVFPADVVRYIGLENLMELRAKAKQGLAKMEAMGQMGNADEATMDDSGEYDSEIDELIENFDPNNPETMEFSQGGVVYAQQGALIPGQMPQQQFSYGYQPPQQQVGYQAPQVPTGQMPDYSSFVSRPAKAAAGQKTGVTEQRQYIGPNGEMITINFIDGVPQQEVPKDYKVYKPEEVKPPAVVTPKVVQQDGGGGDGNNDGPTDPTASMLDGLAAKGFLSENITNIGKEYNNKALMTAGAFLISGPAGFPGAVASGEMAKNAVEEQLAAQMGITVEDFNKNYVEKSGPFGLNREYKTDKIQSKLSETYAISEGEVMGDEKDTSVGSYDSEGNLVGGGAFDRARRDALDAVKSGNVAKAESAMEQAKAAGWKAESSKADTSGEASQSTSTPDRDASGDVGGGRGSDPSGGASGSPFSKGGAVQQTKRALKSSRKK
jgi:hypothetical protein